MSFSRYRGFGDSDPLPRLWESLKEGKVVIVNFECESTTRLLLHCVTCRFYPCT